MKEVASVTAEQSHKPQEAVILVAVPSGLLETGVRYIYSLQEMCGRPSCRLRGLYNLFSERISHSTVVPKPSSFGFLRRTLRTCRLIRKDGRN